MAQKNSVSSLLTDSSSVGQTPVQSKRKPLGEILSPFNVPASPFMKKLGSGSGASVYRLDRAGKGEEIRSPWAVKKVNQCARTNIQDRLAKEASVLKQLHHPNIVGFRGITGNANGDFCLLMEDCQKSLMDLIEERHFLEETLQLKEVLSVAWGVAKALCYLHENKILHGDLKSGNVLICGEFEAVKLCDFGVSVKLKDDLSGLLNPGKDRYVGSEPWKPKEALTKGLITDKADIFPYGLIIWEMFTLSVPHVDLLGSDTDDSYVSGETGDDDDEEDPEEYLQALGTRPPLSAEKFPVEWKPLIELFVCCTHENPADRPSAAKIVEVLEPLAQYWGIDV